MLKASDFKRLGGRGIRATAVRILTNVDVRKSYADILLANALDGAGIDDRDRALLTEIVYGTLRWRARLDAELKPYMRRQIERTDPFLRNLLRLSLYQLRFLDKVPAYAVLNEAVELAKQGRRSGPAAFVNAVLRGTLREGRAPMPPGSESACVAKLVEQWSHPAWMIQKWLNIFGLEETTALLKSNNEPAPLALRVNRLKLTREQLVNQLGRERIEADSSKYSPHGVVLRSRLPVVRLPGFGKGCFQVQSEASQLVVFLLAPQPGERILDACAAPGGKATHIAEMMGDNGQVAAMDISKSGLNKIVENVSRLELRSITTSAADFTKPSPLSGNKPYDRVLVDVPCSGLGTLRSHPEIKWQRSEKDIQRLARLQTRILDHAARAVKPGGVLVYSTCTIAWEENENIVEDFLANHHEFVLEAAADYLPDQAKNMIKGDYFLALPHRHNTDGFFAARMRKAI